MCRLQSHRRGAPAHTKVFYKVGMVMAHTGLRMTDLARVKNSNKMEGLRMDAEDQKLWVCRVV